MSDPSYTMFGKNSNETKGLYSGKEIYFATKHQKEVILAPLFSKINLKCFALKIDTDEFGTFSGEVSRPGSVKETLKRKISKAIEALPNERLFIASEGSFGPHPLYGIGQTDLESLLFFDRELNIEIYAEYLALDPIHAEFLHKPTDDFRKFLNDNQFPEHGFIIRPESSFLPIYKGLHDEQDIAEAILACFKSSKTGNVVIETDLRANHNPRRRIAIYKAGEAMIAKLIAVCLKCSSPGFAPMRGIPGLPCSECEMPSEAPVAHIWQCVKCKYSEQRDRCDGKLYIDPKNCTFCNP